MGVPAAEVRAGRGGSAVTDAGPDAERVQDVPLLLRQAFETDGSPATAEERLQKGDEQVRAGGDPVPARELEDELIGEIDQQLPTGRERLGKPEPLRRCQRVAFVG